MVNQIFGAKARFRLLAEPWAETETSAGRLMIANAWRTNGAVYAA
jgi:hypothetical protein